VGHCRLLPASGRQFARERKIFAAAVALAFLASTSATYGFQFDTGNEYVKARWDNTLKYSTGIRLKDPSQAVTADINSDDGDRNFKKGDLISNRFDLLSEFDLTYKDVGARVSGAAWYDFVYNRTNSNDSTLTANAASVPHNEFTEATRVLHGKNAEILDGFVFGKAELWDMAVTGRAGKHTLLYGESLFFGNNGVAAAQTAIDIVKALSVPNTQFKELMRPVPQVSGQIQVRPNLALGAYYQLAWVKNRLPGVGSYFSNIDFLDEGGEQILAGPPGSGIVFRRTGDIEARNSGQGGIQLRFRPEGRDIECGLYAAQYHSKDPVIYVRPSGAPPPVVGVYQLVYPEDIRVYGASLSTTVGDTNVAGEVSIRRNMPLLARAGTVTVLPPGSAAGDNRDNPLYPVGNTIHAQFSWVALLKPGALWEGGSFIGEIAWHRRQGISKNEGQLDPNASRDASAIRTVFQPTYFQVFSGLDLSVPIGIGYGLWGKSPVMNPGFSVHHGGDFSIGLSADYLRAWTAGISYTHFLGTGDGAVTPANNPAVHAFSYAQSLKDRDFISLTVQRTF